MSTVGGANPRYRDERLPAEPSGDVALELRGARAIHLAHVGGTKCIDDFIAAESGAGAEGHRG